MTPVCLLHVLGACLACVWQDVISPCKSFGTEWQGCSSQIVCKAQGAQVQQVISHDEVHAAVKHTLSHECEVWAPAGPDTRLELEDMLGDPIA